jgi:predicted nucleic acid-binding protein
MPLSRTSLIFFDASSLVAASGSPNGGSGYLISVCRRGYLQAVVTQDVLIESERNVFENLTVAALREYRDIVSSTNFLLVSTPLEAVVSQYSDRFFEDDHVIASALASNSEFLITLDQRFENRVKAAALPIRAMSPGEFLQTIFPTHPEHDQIRQQGSDSAT